MRGQQRGMALHLMLPTCCSARTGSRGRGSPTCCSKRPPQRRSPGRSLAWPMSVGRPGNTRLPRGRCVQATAMSRSPETARVPPRRPWARRRRRAERSSAAFKQKPLILRVDGAARRSATEGLLHLLKSLAVGCRPRTRGPPPSTPRRRPEGRDRPNGRPRARWPRRGHRGHRRSHALRAALSVRRKAPRYQPHRRAARLSLGRLMTYTGAREGPQRRHLRP